MMDLEIESYDLSGTDNPIPVFEAEAIRLFVVGIILSESKDCLCKCRYSPCGRYFLLEKPRRSYRHGTFCTREHQGAFSARERTRELRELIKDDLIERAAKWLLQKRVRDSGWQHDGKLKERVASELNNSSPFLRARGRTVQANWVTRHQQEIEKKRTKLASG